MSNHNQLPKPPASVWRALGAAAVALLLGASVAIAVISAGLFDPFPTRLADERWPLPPLHVAPSATAIRWLEEPLPASTRATQLSATLTEGGADSSYGLAIGSLNHYLAVALSPAGYVSVWQQQGKAEVVHLPWQTWPHLHPLGAGDDIQLTLADDVAIIRINGELLWQGRRVATGSGVALLGQAYSEAARIDYEPLEIYLAAER